MNDPVLLQPGTRVTITNDHGSTESGVYSGIEVQGSNIMLVLDAGTDEWASYNVAFLTNIKRG